MTSSPASSPRAVLHEMGIEPTRVRLIKRGVNTHWLADTADGRIVLRRYASRVSRQSVDFELRVMEFLAGRGWPVPAAVAPMVEADGCLWCACRYLPGRVFVPGTTSSVLAEQRRRGRMLARLHADLVELRSEHQRAGRVRADQGLFDRSGQPPADVVLRKYEARFPETGHILRTHLERVRAQFTELLPDAAEPVVIHGDVVPWNIKYQAGKLSGLLDFELTHLDLRVADFALSWRGRYDEVIRGYEEVSPLEPVERALIVPVYQSWQLACAVAVIEQGSDDIEWELRHLLRRDSQLFAAYG
ncbi:MAG TPA: phosphotransferase [Thermomicrobiaceae bacterium]|nr:phosphotransferase [Thermomicrobiaceae bacterium]